MFTTKNKQKKKKGKKGNSGSSDERLLPTLHPYPLKNKHKKLESLVSWVSLVGSVSLVSLVILVGLVSFRQNFHGNSISTASKGVGFATSLFHRRKKKFFESGFADGSPSPPPSPLFCQETPRLQ